jgi:transposase
MKRKKYYLGIDVSKGYSDFTLLDEAKNPLENVFQLDDNRKGHDALKKFIQDKIKEHDMDCLYCGLESTGGFENNWFNSLTGWSKTMPVKVARLNPSGVKNNIAAGMNRNVTDSLSSRYIAEYLIGHESKVSYDVEDNKYSEFRSLYAYIQIENKQKTQLINEMKMLLYSGFPEMVRFCKQGVPVWVLELLKKYPTAEKVAKLKSSQLSKIRNITAEKAETIIAKAKETVSSRHSSTQEFLIQRLAEQIMNKQESIEKAKKFLIENCNGPEVDLVASIKGIGKYSASCIMIEIENIYRFASTKKLVSYFGVHPELKESGDKIKKYRMSKKGRSSMRSALYMCAQSAAMFDLHFKQIYHHHRSKGKSHKQAIVVIMHKLLRLIWGILMTKKPYEATIDIANQNKKVSAIKDENKRNENKVKRRYQEADLEAPISNRQNKIRKVQSDSQVDIVEQIRDVPIARL